MPKTNKRKKISLGYKKWFVIILLLIFSSFVLLTTLYIQNNPFLLKIKNEFKKYNTVVLEKNNLSVWWISKDNLNIINDNSSGIQLNVNDCVADIGSGKLFYTTAQELGPKVDSIVRKAGFSKNLKNSSKDIDDDRFYDYVQAYERGNQKCVFIANPDCASLIGEAQMYYAFSFACTDDFENNYKAQAPFLKDFEIKDAVIRVDKKIGDYMRIIVNYRRSGSYIIAKLVDGKWKELFAGQDYPPCAIINQYQIPKEISSDCF